jgi:transposase-like protein
MHVKLFQNSCSVSAKCDIWAAQLSEVFAFGGSTAEVPKQLTSTQWQFRKKNLLRDYSKSSEIFMQQSVVRNSDVFILRETKKGRNNFKVVTSLPEASGRMFMKKYKYSLLAMCCASLLSRSPGNQSCR